MSYKSAWKAKHKLLQVMVERNLSRKLSGLIEVDDAYLGGERTGGKPRRGAAHKRPFVAAVSRVEGRPIGLHLRNVVAFGTRASAYWATRSLAPDNTVKSDGLACFAAVSEAGCGHEPTVMGNSRKGGQGRRLQVVNTILGNLKNSLHGTIMTSPSNVPPLLAEF